MSRCHDIRTNGSSREDGPAAHASVRILCCRYHVPPLAYVKSLCIDSSSLILLYCFAVIILYRVKQSTKLYEIFHCLSIPGFQVARKAIQIRHKQSVLLAPDSSSGQVPYNESFFFRPPAPGSRISSYLYTEDRKARCAH